MMLLRFFHVLIRQIDDFLLSLWFCLPDHFLSSFLSFFPSPSLSLSIAISMAAVVFADNLTT